MRRAGWPGVFPVTRGRPAGGGRVRAGRATHLTWRGEIQPSHCFKRDSDGTYPSGGHGSPGPLCIYMGAYFASKKLVQRKLKFELCLLFLALLIFLGW